MPGVALRDKIPNVEADSTHGHTRLYDYIGGSWAIIFSQPADFTPVCTTKLGRIANYIGEFEKHGVKLLGLSSDEVDSHRAWLPDVETCSPGSKITYPILVDPNGEIMLKLNMQDPEHLKRQ